MENTVKSRTNPETSGQKQEQFRNNRVNLGGWEPPRGRQYNLLGGTCYASEFTNLWMGEHHAAAGYAEAESLTAATYRKILKH